MISIIVLWMIDRAQVADAVIGNVQEKTIKQYNASNSEVSHHHHDHQHHHHPHHHQTIHHQHNHHDHHIECLIPSLKSVALFSIIIFCWKIPMFCC